MSAPIAIVAGAGALPWEAAKRIAPRRRVIVFALIGEADPAPPGIETHAVGYGQIGRIFKLMRENGCADVMFLGAIRARPDYRRILGDVQTLKLVPKIVRAVVGGDDSVVRNVMKLVEAEGFRVVSVPEAVPELLAEVGTFGRFAPEARHEADIALGARFLDAASDFDIGQSVVVAEGRIVAVEAAEGTDAMLERCVKLREVKRFRAPRGSGVLVKRAKVGQDMRSDIPVVGAGTLAKVIDAGLGGIAVEAGRTIIAEREAMVAAADKARVFVVAR
ncbi:LpxI family protein [Acuticoccus kandeliae]|uniref:LpxI family protein n=1 Tax=Acuticoccus kandeliae TaxID=2073160 RepID=UPI000D3E32B3|nr:UDP-2,3-diacylglucosamine diphosphatase LpxI [Acuticoccus kandeliae]